MRLLTDEEMEQTMIEEFRRMQGREAPVGYFKPSLNDIAIANASQEATLKAIGGSAVAVEIEGDYLWLKLPRGLIPEPIKINLRGEMPEEGK